MDDTQVDLMGGSDEASNERSSFVVPTGRALRNQKSRKACRSCEEDRKAGKSKVLRILRQRIGRKNQITVLLSPTRRRRGRRKGRLDSFEVLMRVMHSFYVLGKQIYKQLSKVVHFHATSSFGEHSNVSTYELPLRNPLSLFRRYFYFILLFFLHNCGIPATLFSGWGCRQYLQVKMSLKTHVSRRTRRRLLRVAHKFVKSHTQRLCHCF